MRRFNKPWYPNPGPQQDAYWCEADELLYGGEPGGGKTDLLLGVALNEHRRSLILRRLNAEVEGLVERAEEIVGHRNGYNGQKGIWRLKGQILRLSGCQRLDDWKKHQGQPKDFIGFDELANFLEHQYRMLITWARTVIPGQRVRVIAASNPPISTDGQWMNEYWAPWLMQDHPNPAVDGELRWYTSVDDKDYEVDGPGPVYIDGEILVDHQGNPIEPKSRTFIRSELSDNPDLSESGYSSRLATLSGDARLMAKGDFTAGQRDHAYQVIPQDWVQAAMDRWHSGGSQGEMTALAVDIAQGGPDQTVISRRHGGWFDNLIVTPGVDTKDGPAVASQVLLYMRDSCEVVLDMGGGYGQSAFDHLKQTLDPTTYLGASGYEGRDRTGEWTFKNLRAASWWNLLEALDPHHGSQIALPPDPALKAELCSPQRKPDTGKVIQIESKEDVRKRLGRSTDRADAIIMAWWATGLNRQKGSSTGRDLPASAVTSRSRGGKRRRR